MISVIITAYKESSTIGKVIRCLVDAKYSGYSGKIQLIQVSPDYSTLQAGANEAKKYNCQYIQIKDHGKGKPSALNLAWQQATGDIWVMTDGEVYFAFQSLCKLLNYFNDSQIVGVTCRPKALNAKTTIMGYWANLLVEVAHHRRNDQQKGFYPFSGYGFAVRQLDFILPKNVLVDDAYITYKLKSKGAYLAYAPQANVYVLYPNNLRDFYLQKNRTTKGYLQLKQYDFVKKAVVTRSPFIELKYAWFVISYAQSIKELWWSILLFPGRLLVWFLVWWDYYLQGNKVPTKPWSRIDSTK